MNTGANEQQLVLMGRAVSRGAGIGKILLLYGRKRQFYRIRLNEENVGDEIERFRTAVRLAESQLEELGKEIRGANNKHQTAIFETHLLFLKDNSLLGKIEKLIESETVCAEWAVQAAGNYFAESYRSLSDPLLVEKAVDLEDVLERLLAALGRGKRKSVPEPEAIIAAHEIRPSTLIELAKHNPAAIITENGGWTSHTFILARELEIPAVTGLKRLMRIVDTGMLASVDGYRGEVIVNPDQTSKRGVRGNGGLIARSQRKDSIAPSPVETLDGYQIKIRANTDLSGSYEKAKDLGAQGVGLYRSEFLFSENHGYPTEDEQFESYKKIADEVGEEGVRIRTFDLGIDELSMGDFHREKNPALGLRGVRLALKHEGPFRTQIRALLRASFERRLDILLPMISDVLEIRTVRKIINEERENLLSQQVAIGTPKLGAMIELPSAVLTVEDILTEVDFLGLGTNDLVQYLFAVDRDNEDVAEWFRTLHPAVLKSVKAVLVAAKRLQKGVILCGEMAGTPQYVFALLGLGARELSMNAGSITRVRKLISSVAIEEARICATAILRCKTSVEVEAIIDKYFAENLSHLI